MPHYLGEIDVGFQIVLWLGMATFGGMIVAMLVVSGRRLRRRWVWVIAAPVYVLAVSWIAMVFLFDVSPRPLPAAIQRARSVTYGFEEFKEDRWMYADVVSPNPGGREGAARLRYPPKLGRHGAELISGLVAPALTFGALAIWLAIPRARREVGG